MKKFDAVEFYVVAIVALLLVALTNFLFWGSLYWAVTLFL